MSQHAASSCMRVLLLVLAYSSICGKVCGAHSDSLCHRSSEITSRQLQVQPDGTLRATSIEPFSTDIDWLSRLANESWFTVFSRSRQQCLRLCAELRFKDPSVRFYCAGMCDGSGESDCTCDQLPQYSRRGCSRNMGTKMCNCSRSVALQTASALGASRLVAEPAFLVRFVGSIQIVSLNV